MAWTALHLPLGDRTAINLVDRWLSSYAIRAIAARDAFEVCALLLRKNTPVCDVVFVGTDWLTVAEQNIFEYIHHVWPDAVIVAYGDGARDLDEQIESLVIAVPNEQALFALLMESPETLLPRKQNGHLPTVNGASADESHSKRGAQPQPPAPRSATAQLPTNAQATRSRIGPREWTNLLDENES